MRIKFKYISSAIPVVLGMVLLSLGRVALITQAENDVENETKITRQVEHAILEAHLGLQSEIASATQFLITGKLGSLEASYHRAHHNVEHGLTELENLLTPRDDLADLRLGSLRRRHAQLSSVINTIFAKKSISNSEMRQYLITLQTYQSENDVLLSELFESVDRLHLDLERSIDSLQQQTRWLEGLSLGLILLLLLWQYRWLCMPMFKALDSLRQGAVSLGQGKLSHRLSVDTQDELAQLAHAFNTMAQQLEDSYTNLEATVAERTKALADTNASLEQEICDRINTEEQLTATLEQLRHTQAQLIHTEKMSGLGHLVAGVAHEINNPASFIAGNLAPAKDYAHTLLQLLQRYQNEYPNPSPELAADVEAANLDFIAADYPKLLKSMGNGVARINRIVESLRTFSCLNEASHKQVNLHHHLDSTLMLLESKLQGPPITVVKDYGQIPLISCYPSHLNQVFMHLLVNAIEALTTMEHPLPNKLPTITIRTTMVASSNTPPHPLEKIGRGSQVLVTIADNGPGIPETIKSHIFDPFFSSKPVGKGTGLGLSTGHQIITNLHKGRLEYRDVPEGGTAFDIYLPFNLPGAQGNGTNLCKAITN
ncbi:MAG: ATP-binding protein [Cyanobacteria bacterium P01_D01_bin.56]